MFITSYFPDDCGGAEQQCRRLSEELVRHGHAVTILTTRAGRDVPRMAVENGVRVIRLARFEACFRRSRPAAAPAGPSGTAPAAPPAQPAEFRKWAAAILRTLNLWLFLAGSAGQIWRLRREIDVWHVHVATLVSGWCALWAGRWKIPVVCKGANIPVFFDEPAMPWKRTLAAARRRTTFIALTPEMKDDLVAHGVPAEKIAWIPNGIAVPAAGPRPDPGGPGFVLYVANLTQPVANKAFDVLFAAWADVHARRPEARLVVAGAGDPGPWREFLRARNAAAAVDFRGRVADMDGLYRQAALLVLPSRREGISNALLEAQSHGVPAVVSDIPGNAAVVVHGQTGLRVPVGDAAALADGIVRLLDDAALRARLGRAAQERIAADFALGAVAERVGALYARMVKEVRE